MSRCLIGIMDFFVVLIEHQHSTLKHSMRVKVAKRQRHGAIDERSLLRPLEINVLEGLTFLKGVQLDEWEGYLVDPMKDGRSL